MSFFFSTRRRPTVTHNRTRKNYSKIRNGSVKIPKVIVGKIYANWCIHCVNLKPEWNKMMKSVYKQKTPSDIKFVSIEETNMQNKMKSFFKKYKIPENIQKSFKKVQGFPTIFKIKNGNVTFYNKERIEEPMREWVLE